MADLSTNADLIHAFLLPTADVTKGNNETTPDLYDDFFSGDVIVQGSINGAFIANWGVAGDTAVEAERRQYGATVSETIAEARQRYYTPVTP